MNVLVLNGINLNMFGKRDPAQYGTATLDDIHTSLQQLAQELGVSRQPVQQALTLLRKEGVLHDAPGRGLQVAPMDLEHVRHMYEVRAVIEGLAFRKAAENMAAHLENKAAEEPAHKATDKIADKGAALLRAGRKGPVQVINGGFTCLSFTCGHFDRWMQQEGLRLTDTLAAGGISSVMGLAALANPAMTKWESDFANAYPSAEGRHHRGDRFVVCRRRCDTIACR